MKSLSKMTAMLAMVTFLLLPFASYLCAQDCVSPPSGLVSWWTLDEISGEIANDSIGENQGTHVNGPTPSYTCPTKKRVLINKLLILNDKGISWGIGDPSTQLWTVKALEKGRAVFLWNIGNLVKERRSQSGLSSCPWLSNRA